MKQTRVVRVTALDDWLMAYASPSGVNQTVVGRALQLAVGHHDDDIHIAPRIWLELGLGAGAVHQYRAHRLVRLEQPPEVFYYVHLP